MRSCLKVGLYGLDLGAIEREADRPSVTTGDLGNFEQAARAVDHDVAVLRAVLRRSRGRG
jgi:hypothetical protein